jgi:hypothetical protein
LVQLAIETKRRINETTKGCPINLNGLSTNVDLNIIPLGYFDSLIGMDWMDKHHVVLDCHDKTFTCLDEERKTKHCERNSKTHFYKGDFSLTIEDMF